MSKGVVTELDGLIVQHFMVWPEWVLCAMSVHCGQWYAQQINSYPKLTVNLSKSKKNPNSYAFFRFPISSPLNSLLSQINEFPDLHSISDFPINRVIPTGQVYAGFLTKTSYVLLAFFIHLALLSTVLIISVNHGHLHDADCTGLMLRHIA